MNTERRERRLAKLRATDMMLSFGHPPSCNGGNPNWRTHHDHQVILEWTDDDHLKCPECGRIQELED